MTKNVLVVGVCLFVVAAAAAYADDLVFDVPYLEGIAIDGEVSDWGNRGFYVGLLADEQRQFKAAEDFDGRLWLGWDEQGLLVRAQGRDDQYVEHPEDWSIWAMDAVELFMAVEPGSRDRYQICVAPGHTEAQPDLRIQFYEFRDTPALRAIEMTGDAAASRSGDTYTLEVRMPWSNLALAPEMGMTVGFQIYLNDQDPDDPSYQPRYTAMWYPGGQSNWNPERMYRVRLADKPSPPVLSMATVHTFSEVPLAWVEVNAVEDLVGQEVIISGPALREPARVKYVEHDGRAVARLYVPTKSKGADPAGVALTTEGEPVLNVARLTAGMPWATVDVAEKDGKYIFTPRLEPRGPFPANKKTDLTLYDIRGEQVNAFKVLPGERVEAQLESGAYLFRVEYPDVFEEPITGSLGFAAGFPSEPSARLARLEETVEAVKTELDESAIDTYEGWWLYKLERLEQYRERPDKSEAHEASLLEWLLLPVIEPDALFERRGTFEWAYRSEADNSGQPFTMRVPYGLDTNAPMPAYLWLHGSGGGHQDLKDLPGHLGMLVLARGRSQGYGNLACADVFDVYDYVRARWQLDPDRLKLFGASMGGAGTTRIASRRPDLFAAASPWCGGAWVPLNNLINVPVYALHGSTDDLAAMAFSKTMADKLAQLDGMAILDVAPNYAHGLEGPPEARAAAWLAEQVRPSFPDRISYTAMDGGAMSAYGLRVIEWGQEWRPARFDAVRENGALFLSVDNIRTLEVGLPGIDTVSVNNGRPIDVPAYDGAFYVTTGPETRVTNAAPSEPEIPFHTPGGAISLYTGEPLMVVWGTQADEETNAIMLNTADRLRRTPSPAVRPDGEPGESNFMPYGKLYGKPDTEVTDEDFHKYHMVLLGTADQNAVVARLASQLPLTLRGGELRTSDGVTWPAEGLGWSLTHYNPFAPEKLILWVASEVPEFYAPLMPVLPEDRNEHPMPDLVVSDAMERRLAGVRNFDPRWRWTESAADYLESPLLPEKYCSVDGFGHLIAEAIFAVTAADATFTEVVSPNARYESRTGWLPGMARRVDVENRIFRGIETMTLELSEEELRSLESRLPELREDASTTYDLVMGEDAKAPYVLLVSSWQAGSILNRIFEWNPRAQPYPSTIDEIIERALPELSATW